MTDGEDRPVLALTDVRRTFSTQAGAVAVLDGIDLTVDPGEVVAIKGRSGSGKTTLLTIIAGWDRPDSGSVELPIGSVADGRPGWSEVAILPQSLALLDELTIAENVTLPLRLGAGAPARDPVEIMTQLGIEHLADRHPSEVSLGEQQRAALARAAVVQPRLLVADEPISHQNREWAESMMVVVGVLAARGTACVLATHDDVAFEVADRVLELRGGRLEPIEIGRDIPWSVG